jgi:TetR/AcrR family transcriptional repressor of mexJK operon
MGQMKTAQKRGRGRPVNEARREEIIATAGRLFGELGLHATTMEHIAKELKISKITLYSRFADKDELFTAVIQAKCQQHIPDQFFGDVDKHPMEESLYRVAYGLMELLTSDGAMDMERMLMGADARVRSKLTTLFYEAGPQRIKRMAAANLEKLHAEKKLNVPNPKFSANLFAAMIKGSDICMRAHMQIPPKTTKKEMQTYCRDAVGMFISAHNIARIQ